MKTKVKKYSRPGVALVLLILWSVALRAAAPAGWLLAGSKPASYETGTDRQALYNAHPSAYLKSKEPVTNGFGTLMQQLRADHYAGKRLRLSAFVKSDEVQDWAGLWMRVDKDAQAVAFDNMQDRPIKGNTNWQRYEVTLEVPQDATGIAFGILLSESGTVWLNSVKLEVVGTEVPTTGGGQSGPRHPIHDEPENLNFENQ